MVVARIGVAAVAVVGVGREGLLVVPLDAGDARLEKNGEDAVRVRAEGPEISEGVERVRSPVARALDRGFEGACVAVDAAEEGETRFAQRPPFLKSGT